MMSVRQCRGGTSGSGLVIAQALDEGQLIKDMDAWRFFHCETYLLLEPRAKHVEGLYPTPHIYEQMTA